MTYTRLLTEEEVSAAMDEWCSDDSLNCALHEYLGWTWVEYAHYVGTGELPKPDKYKDN